MLFNAHNQAGSAPAYAYCTQHRLLPAKQTVVQPPAEHFQGEHLKGSDMCLALHVSLLLEHHDWPAAALFLAAHQAS